MADEQPDDIQYKEPLNYGNLLLRLIDNVARSFEGGGSAWKEFDILWSFIPGDIKKDIPEIETKYLETKDKLSRMPRSGARYGPGMRGSIPWYEDTREVEYNFTRHYAIEKVVTCLHKHNLLFYTDKKIETGRL